MTFPQPMTTTDVIALVGIIITALFALYGAILSTYTFVVQRRENKPKIVISVTHGFLDFGSSLSEMMLIVEAANVGRVPVMLSSVGIRLPNKQQLIFRKINSNIRLPHRLEPGEGCSVWMERIDIASQLQEKGRKGKIKLRGFYLSQTGDRYYSKPYILDIDKVIRDNEE